jgi:hypothetical protein
MKKFVLIAVAALVTGLYASPAPAEELCDEPKVIEKGNFEKDGFLTTEKCAAAGAFTDCYLENYICGYDGCYEQTEAGVDKNTPLVLFSHNDGAVYKLDTSAVARSEFDEGVNRNGVTIIGEFDASTNTVVVHEFKAPPPPKKSFFKGCL